jgi:hypothetical protein
MVPSATAQFHDVSLPVPFEFLIHSLLCCCLEFLNISNIPPSELSLHELFQFRFVVVGMARANFINLPLVAVMKGSATSFLCNIAIVNHDSPILMQYSQKSFPYDDSKNTTVAFPSVHHTSNNNFSIIIKDSSCTHCKMRSYFQKTDFP